MVDRPEPVARLYSLLDTSLIAHRAIYDLHRRLVVAGSAEISRELVRESADIALREMPAAAAEMSRLVKRWSEQSLLDPEAAKITLKQLEAELPRIEPRLRELLDRQAAIARELQSRLGR